MKNLKLHIILFLLLSSFTGCQEKIQVKPTLNYAHLDYLYKEVVLPNGENGGIIHIYSNYPNYKYAIEPKEGFACVDDAARALILLSQDKNQIQKSKKLTSFLLYMQNKNGWFNNFIWKDLSINTNYKTSIAEPSWWSWRAFWALEAVLPKLQNRDTILASKVKKTIDKLVPNIELYLKNLPVGLKTVQGIKVPTQLPFESAADQSSILLVGLTLNYKRTKNPEILKLIKHLADGILQMQIEDGIAKGAFLSWENQWHAYGNLQSFALLKVGASLNEKKYTNVALFEINHFYHYLWEHKMFSDIEFSSINGETQITKSNIFPQIAYGIRPIIYANVEAYKQTGEIKYKKNALKWMSWFDGKNIASAKMYNSKNGRCFDGILSKFKINKNSGAESTIEALLSIAAVNSITKTN
ncbi:hypothetical protein [Lutibacter sp.]|uniref:hypothetical protein n=1 Tax=Lutibacter sp. TaxID=1925666 RepID=UPI0025C1F0D6|nr:hypothetical protein [Lutibacter sp.]MCF6181922.1 hypothetical protein [Lutibacter sp.]